MKFLKQLKGNKTMKVLITALLLTTFAQAADTEWETIDCRTVPAYGTCIKTLAGSATAQAIDAFCTSYSHGLACNKTTAMGICVGAMVEKQGLTLTEALTRCLGK